MARLEFTRSTKLAAWERSGGSCEGCGRKLFPGDRREFDHRIPDGLRKDNGLENCQVLCGPCHDEKTPGDSRQISKAKRVKAKHEGAFRPKATLPGGKASGWKRKISGEWVRRDD